MSYASLLIGLYLAIFVVTWLIFIYAFPLRKLTASRMLIVLTVSFCVTAFCTLNVYAAQNFEMKVLFSRMRFLGFAFLAPCWLLFLSSIFDRWTWLLKKWALVPLFIPGLVTILLTLIPETRDLVVTGFQPYSTSGFSVVTFHGGPWFPFFVGSSYLLIFLSYALGAHILVKGNAQEKKQIFILLAGCLTSVAVDLYCLKSSSSSRWLMTPGSTFILNQAAVFYAMFRYRILDISPVAIEKIFQDIPDPILVVDSNSFLRTANLSARHVFRLTPNSFGKQLKELIPEMNNALDELVLNSETEPRFFSIRRENLKSESKTPHGVILSFREMTAQKKTERRLNENLDFKARLLAVIAHDLSGNMKNQALLSSLLLDQVAPEYRAHISMLQSSTSASSDLMSNILAWAKSQEDQFIPQKKRFEMRALLRECLELLETTFELNGIQVHLELRTQPIVVNGDSEMISSVVRNLLSNSIRASHQGKSIFVAAEADEKSVTVKIRDEGIGMSREQSEALMEQSVQLLSAHKEPHAGYGIGLKIARRFIELHEGEFFIESIVGVGTTVCFRIPI